MHLRVIILAAGKGKRMASEIPKVMHTLAGVPLLQRVYNAATALNPYSIQIVYGNGRGLIRKSFEHLEAEWVHQEEQLGTGHAVLQALPGCNDEDRVLILYGDVPLLSSQTLRNLLEITPVDSIGLLVANVTDPFGLGRIVRDPAGRIMGIVEERDADEAHRRIKEINTGILVCPGKLLKQKLPNLKPHNNQKELYLTDLIALAVAENIAVKTVCASSEHEVRGVNDLWQLGELERWYQEQQAKQLSLAGVRVLDPRRLDLRGDEIKIAADVTLDVNVILEGKTSIGKHSKIGANCVIKDTVIGEHVTILPNTVIEGAIIQQGCQVGPFARLRQGTELAEDAKVGNFVETKKIKLGVGSKASHLTYLGDATIGAHVNIGAGTITCNYDGVNKWETIIRDGAFIGSNTSLVAPVEIGENATIGAGSTVSNQVPANQLTLARARQQTIEGWVRPDKQDKIKT